MWGVLLKWAHLVLSQLPEEPALFLTFHMHSLFFECYKNVGSHYKIKKSLIKHHKEVLGDLISAKVHFLLSCMKPEVVKCYFEVCKEKEGEKQASLEG